METRLTRQQASEAVGRLGWRLVLGTFTTSVAVPSLATAAGVVAAAVAACGDDVDGHLRADVRAGRVVLALQTFGEAWVTRRDVDLAHRVSAAVAEMGLGTDPHPGADVRSVQLVEIAIDALDIAAVRPLWKAVLAYGDEPGYDAPTDAIVDPLGEGPAVWFQQMDAPRPQRNRIHLDIAVPHDEAERRIAAALAACGHLVSDTRAPAFWVLADAEGNEACITTWQARDA